MSNQLEIRAWLEGCEIVMNDLEGSDEWWQAVRKELLDDLLEVQLKEFDSEH